MQSEIQKFEAHIRTINERALSLGKWSDGSFRHIGLQGCWEGWEARAKVAEQPDDERAAFEAFLMRLKPEMLFIKKNWDGTYHEPAYNDAWLGWTYRAAAVQELAPAL